MVGETATFMLSLEALKHDNGPHLQHILDEIGDGNQWQGVDLIKHDLDLQQFQNSKTRILNRIMDYTQDRVNRIENDNILRSTKIFDMSEWPATQQELARYGVPELNSLIDHFQQPLQRLAFEAENA